MTDYARAVELALALLGSIARDGSGSAAALGRRLGLERKAMQRILEPLDRRGYIRRDTDGEYVLGAALFELSTQVEPELGRAARPALELLADRFGETAALAVPDRDDAVAIDHVPGEPHLPQVRYRPGSRHPLYLAAHGRAILAFLDPDTIERVLAPPPMAELVHLQLEEVRRVGYAISVDELQQGACGLAAPVRDDAGQVVGSIGVVAPLERFPPATYLAPAVYEAAATVGMAPGWRQRRPDPAGPLLPVT